MSPGCQSKSGYGLSIPGLASPVVDESGQHAKYDPRWENRVVESLIRAHTLGKITKEKKCKKLYCQLMGSTKGFYRSV